MCDQAYMHANDNANSQLISYKIPLPDEITYPLTDINKTLAKLRGC